MKVLPPVTPADTAGAVDLDNPPCTGCRHHSRPADAPHPICRRMPPVFVPAQPMQTPQGMQLQPGGWSWPPAIVKCGEFMPKGIVE